MKRWIKRTIKSILITIASLVLLVVATLGIAIYIIFTPEKLTPLIEGVASDYIDGQLTFDSVELTAFATFPNVGIRLRSGLLSSTKGDSTAKSDTIVSFDVLDVVVAPLDFIFRNRISVKHIAMQKPFIYAYIDTTGRANWDVFKFDSDTTVSTDTTKFDATLALNKFVITDGHMIYDDRMMRLYTKVDSLGVSLKGNMDKRSDMTLELGFRRGLFWQDNALLASRVSTNITIDGQTEPTLKRLLINKAMVDVNGIKLDANGWISRDSLNVKATFLSPTLSTVVGMLPRAYVSQADKMTADGEVAISATAQGGFRKEYPLIDLNISVKNGKFQYTGFQYGVDQLDLNTALHLDLNESAKSTLDITKLYAQGAALNLNLSGRASHILTNPTFKASTDITLDFTKLAQTLPLRKTVAMGGQFAFNGSIATSLNSMTDMNWSRIIADGTLRMDELWLSDEEKNFQFSTSSANITISHLTIHEVEIKGTLGDIKVSHLPAYRATLSEANISATGLLDADTISSIKGTLGYTGLEGGVMNDTLTLRSSASKVSLKLDSKKQQLRFRTDTIVVKSDHSSLRLLSAGINITTSHRSLIGAVSFRKLNIRTPHLPLRVSIDSTLLKVKNDRVELSKAAIQLGRSNVKLSGSVENAMASFFHPELHKKIIIRGSILSDTMDLNQLIRAIDKGTQYKHALEPPETVEQEIDSDTSQLPIIMIGPTIDARLDARFGNLQFGKLNINNAQGHITIDNGQSLFKDLTIHYQGSKLVANTLYAPVTPILANTTLSLTAEKIDLNSLKGLTPLIDSLSPMINSIEGVVSIDIAAQAVMDTFLIPNFDKIELSTELRADHLVVMDNETFAEISKMLMFKNKERNVIDSINVQAVVKNGVVEIFPFSMVLDRYRVALGGTQHLNGELQYHVSVLKSPIPFKFGVNITGNFDKLKIGVGKTQYKSLFPADGPMVRLNPFYEQTRKQILLPLPLDN